MIAFPFLPQKALRFSLILLGFSASLSAFAAPREALIIVNSDYSTSDTLENLQHQDVTYLQNSLKRNGFATTVVTDLSEKALFANVEDFAKTHLDKNTEYALIYYFGHVYSEGDQGFLLPVNAEKDGDNHFKNKVNINDIILPIHNTEAQTNIIVIDGKTEQKFPLLNYENYPQTWVLYYTLPSNKKSSLAKSFSESADTPDITVFGLFNSTAELVMAEDIEFVHLSFALGNFNPIFNKTVLDFTDISLSKLPQTIILRQDWDLPEESDKEAETAALNAMEAYQKDAIEITPYRATAELCAAPDSDTFDDKVNGLLKLTSYYYYFHHLLNKDIPYNNQELPTLDQYLQNIKIDDLKYLAETGITILTPEDKKEVLSFARGLQDSFAPFYEQITLDKILTLNLGQNNIPYAVDELFAHDDSCVSRVYISSDNIKGNIFNHPNTYFSFSQLQSYYYGFWFRRLYHGTARTTKELLDYVVTELEK